MAFLETCHFATVFVSIVSYPTSATSLDLLRNNSRVYSCRWQAYSSLLQNQMAISKIILDDNNAEHGFLLSLGRQSQYARRREVGKVRGNWPPNRATVCTSARQSETELDSKQLVEPWRILNTGFGGRHSKTVSLHHTWGLTMRKMMTMIIPGPAELPKLKFQSTCDLKKHAGFKFCSTWNWLLVFPETGCRKERSWTPRFKPVTLMTDFISNQM